ncbi:uncharacterized protein LOC144381292 isoform X2 [Halichoerus grypus]
MQFFQQVVKRRDNSRQHMQGRMCDVFSQQQRVCRKNQISSCFAGCQRDRQQRRNMPAQKGRHGMETCKLPLSSQVMFRGRRPGLYHRTTWKVLGLLAKSPLFSVTAEGQLLRGLLAPTSPLILCHLHLGTESSVAPQLLKREMAAPCRKRVPTNNPAASGGSPDTPAAVTRVPSLKLPGSWLICAEGVNRQRRQS